MRQVQGITFGVLTCLQQHEGMATIAQLEKALGWPTKCSDIAQCFASSLSSFLDLYPDEFIRGSISGTTFADNLAGDAYRVSVTGKLIPELE